MTVAAGGPRTRSWKRRSITVVVVAVAATVTVLVWPAHVDDVGVATGGVDRGCTTTPTTATSTTSSTTTSSTTSTTTTTVAPPPTTVPPQQALTVGATGPAVLELEQALDRLAIWVAAPDGVYDRTTAHAVTVFQKLHGLARDGVAGPQVQAALATAAPIRPSSTVGHVLEIDVTRQVLLVVDDGVVIEALDVSTGRVPGTTPVGHFRITRQIDGYHRSRLGVLYRPKYFSGGVAIHGYPSVPPYPASHGCVRTTNAAMDWLWSSGVAPVGTAVWVTKGSTAPGGAG